MTERAFSKREAHEAEHPQSEEASSTEDPDDATQQGAAIRILLAQLRQQGLQVTLRGNESGSDEDEDESSEEVSSDSDADSPGAPSPEAH
jgi:hypothetical protein